MANRSIQAKIVKLKASKRKAYLNRPRSGGVDQGKIAAHDIFQNRSRVNTATSGRDGSPEPILNNTWLQLLPPKLKLRLQDLDTTNLANRLRKFLVWDPDEKIWVKTPRFDIEAKIALDKIVEDHAKDEGSVLLGALRMTWQGLRGQRIVVYNSITIKESEGFSIKLHFAGIDFRFIQETEDTRWISKQYKSHAEAMTAYKTKISWIKMESKTEGNTS